MIRRWRRWLPAVLAAGFVLAGTAQVSLAQASPGVLTEGRVARGHRDLRLHPAAVAVGLRHKFRQRQGRDDRGRA